MASAMGTCDQRPGVGMPGRCRRWLLPTLQAVDAACWTPRQARGALCLQRIDGLATSRTPAICAALRRACSSRASGALCGSPARV